MYRHDSDSNYIRFVALAGRVTCLTINEKRNAFLIERHNSGTSFLISE